MPVMTGSGPGIGLSPNQRFPLVFTYKCQENDSRFLLQSQNWDDVNIELSSAIPSRPQPIEMGGEGRGREEGGVEDLDEGLWVTLSFKVDLLLPYSKAQEERVEGRGREY